MACELCTSKQSVSVLLAQELTITPGEAWTKNADA